MSRRNLLNKTEKCLTSSKFCIFVFIRHICVDHITCSRKGFFINAEFNLTSKGASQEVQIYDIKFCEFCFKTKSDIVSN